MPAPPHPKEQLVTRWPDVAANFVLRLTIVALEVKRRCALTGSLKPVPMEYTRGVIAGLDRAIHLPRKKPA